MSQYGQPYNPNPGPLVRATPQHRLAGYALDLVLLPCTCYIGWFVWSMITWGQGQTPAKQILKMRVYNGTNGQVASWGHMALRQFVLPLAFSMPFLLSRIFSINGNVFFSILGLFIGLGGVAVNLLDSFWIFKGGENHRLVDVFAKTEVVNEAR